MQSPGDSDYRLRQMQIASPRSPLNCQALSVHLPAASSYQASRSSSSYQPLPMSNSPAHQNASHYHQKSGTPRYIPTSPTLLPPSYEKGNPANLQQRSRDPSGSHLLPDSPAYTSGPLRSPLHLSTDTTPYDEKSYDDLILNSQHSPGTMNLSMGSPGVARRAKAHVPSACVNCKRKHLACETRRPCNRCLQAGKEATCVDVQHKKRGRPRLRDEDNGRGANYGEYAHPQLYPAQSDSIALEGSSQRNHYRPLSYRELRSQPDSPYGGVQDNRSPLSRSGIPPTFSNIDPSREIRDNSQKEALIKNLPEVNPTALLTLDFVVSQSNVAFIDALALRTQADGKALKDLVIPSEKEKIKRLQNTLTAEMHGSMQTPYYRSSRHEYTSGTSPEEQDLFESTVGFQPRSEYWTFRLPNGQSRGYPISISLAKTHAYFVVLTLVSGSNPPLALTTPGSQGGWTPSPPTSSHSLQSPYSQRLVERPRRSEIAPTTNPYQPYAPKSVPETTLDRNLRGQDSPLDPGEFPQYRRPRSSSLTHDSRTPPSAGSAGTTRSSLHGSDVPQENLRHLQLPPIRTSAVKESSRAMPSSHASSSRRSSPAKASPQSAKRKKRRRVDIGEMLLR